MFTGIIEGLGTILKIEKEDQNIHFTVQSDISKDLKIDQSISHNGVCLTVVAQDQQTHRVTAIQETLLKSSLGNLKENDVVNLERCTIAGGRLDGHIVQGHVDQTAVCVDIEDQGGSTLLTFEYDASLNNITVEKGSITVDGISLTVVNSRTNRFSVAIIPYTKEHTNFAHIAVGTVVNIEFDIIGKYVSKLLSLRD
ncbi:riboflavin synthase [Sphingobacterium corticibacter]|uniref:Riboflavin synthase n=1 Tax=Sphingobacterium corticibacter TaxID=2171749 RepID=A0A2T8HGJ5_9SPHI|nr:riboflavin synthase [Sphingobacterium corticibacter]PVH24567.1 riboflavin synthase [Sphingobacterium corticibacter]